MHAIERHLLDCDFCQEAMDGLESSNVDIGRDVSELTEHLHNRAGVTKVEPIAVTQSGSNPYWGYKIAAVVALLVVGTYLLFFNQSDTISHLALDERQEVGEMSLEDLQDEEDAVAANDQPVIASNEPTVTEEVRRDVASPNNPIVVQESQDIEPIVSAEVTNGEVMADLSEETEPLLAEETAIGESPAVALNADQAIASGAGGQIASDVMEDTAAEEEVGFAETDDFEFDEEQPTIVLSTPARGSS